MSSRFLLSRHLNSAVSAILFSVVGFSAQAENIPLDHPASGVVKEYLGAVVKQDWMTAATMLLPTSLERKQKETIQVVKTAPTMSDENEMLRKLGVKDISDLDKMTPQEFYAADRMAVHQKMSVSPEIKRKKQETLKIDVISLGGEDENRVVHAVVRTSQETLDARIEELFLISMIQDKENPKKWLVVPDMMRPMTTPLAAASAAPAATPPAPTSSGSSGSKSKKK